MAHAPRASVSCAAAFFHENLVVYNGGILNPATTPLQAESVVSPNRIALWRAGVNFRHQYFPRPMFLYRNQCEVRETRHRFCFRNGTIVDPARRFSSLWPAEHTDSGFYNMW